MCVCVCVWGWSKGFQSFFLMFSAKYTIPQIDTPPATPFCLNTTVSPIYNSWLAFQGGFICTGYIKLHLNARVYQND